MLDVRMQNGAASSLDSVKVIIVGFKSWKSEMEKYNASHQDKCEIPCLDKNNQVHQYRLVMTDWAAELQRSSCIMVDHRLNVCLHFHTGVKRQIL